MPYRGITKQIKHLPVSEQECSIAGVVEIDMTRSNLLQYGVLCMSRGKTFSRSM